MNNKLCFAIILTAFAYTANAQFSVGIRSGILISHMAYNGNTEFVSNISQSTVNPWIGIMGDYMINDNFSIKTGINYMTRGSYLGANSDIEVLGINVPIGITSQFITKSIDIPLSLQYNFPLDSYWSLYGYGGIGLSKTLSAKIESKAQALLSFNLPDVPVSTDSFNDLESFGNIGVGAKYKIGYGSLFGEISYQHAFETITPQTIIDIDIKNKGFSVGIGYAMSF
jgi:hypothetical protein